MCDIDLYLLLGVDPTSSMVDPLSRLWRIRSTWINLQSTDPFRQSLAGALSWAAIENIRRSVQ